VALVVVGLFEDILSRRQQLYVIETFDYGLFGCFLEHSDLLLRLKAVEIQKVEESGGFSCICDGSDWNSIIYSD
jgi:hypothetical protein